jgi:hypothetical protein
MGTPPTDALGRNAWAHGVLVLAMHKAISPRGIDDSEKSRIELVLKIAGGMRGLLPHDELHAAVDVVRGDARRESSTRTGPELEDATQLSPATGQPKAKRGRPRKRSLL